MLVRFLRPAQVPGHALYAPGETAAFAASVALGLIKARKAVDASQPAAPVPSGDAGDPDASGASAGTSDDTSDSPAEGTLLDGTVAEIKAAIDAMPDSPETLAELQTLEVAEAASEKSRAGVLTALRRRIAALTAEA